MNNVNFDELNSYDNFGLILTQKTITAPSPKTTVVDIPGGDGSIDFTEYFGDINYNNRKLTFEFSTIVPKRDFLELFSKIQNTLHGKKMKVTLDDDPEYYYYGRITVDEWKSNKRIGKLTIEVDAEPYKYRKSVTTISDVISATKNIVCVNLRKSVVPKITVSAETTIKFGNYQIVVLSGSITDDNIVFKQGQNILTVTPVTGSISIVIEYQERGL